MNFCQLVNPSYEPAWFHERIAEILERALKNTIEGKKTRIILSIPPRHGKTQLSSIYFPAWALGKYPDLKFILTTYGAELSEDVGMKTRDTISSESYQAIFPDVGLKADTKSKAKWMTNKGGSYTAVGIGGAITGKGGNCFTGDTLVLTEDGYERIDTLLQSQKRVLSYNHETNNFEWKRILAGAKREMRNIIQITTSGGCSIRCTPEHRIFVKNKGYIRADSLEQGEKLLRIQQNEKNTCFNEMFFVSRGIFESKIRSNKMVQKIFKGLLLFVGVFTKTSFYKKQACMYNLWGFCRKKDTKILQKERVPKINEEANAKTMRCLFESIPTNKSFNKNMFNGMFKRFAFSKNDGGKESKLQTRSWFERLSSRVLSIKEKGCFKGQQRVSNMSIKNRYDMSPYRSQPKKQYNGELNNVMQKLSLQTPYEQGDTISSVERFSHKEDVYDIQVEDNHNFFANGILVHNCIIIDDPHKDRAEAESELARKNVWDYYRSTLYSRLEGLGTIIVIMQRWRQDDLVGLLLEEDERIKKENPDSAENWEVIDFPAIAVDDEYDENGKLIRKEGEPLWKDKYPMEFLSLIRQQSPYFWASQYMQNPILAEVAEFKKEYFRYFNEEDLQGKYLRYYTICDPAISQKKSGDNTVVVTIAKEVNGPNFYRIREDAGKYTPQQTIDLIFQHQNEYHSEVAVETVQYQQALKFMVVEEQRRRGQFFIMHELKSSQKKEERIRGMLALYQNGLMHHRYGDLNYEEELLAFPNGRRDDRIDAAAYIIQIANNTFTGNGVKQFKQKWLGYGRKAR